MSVTYTEEAVRNTEARDEAFVPRYARTKRSSNKGGVRTWMILAPIGALALIGGGAAMILGGGTETQPLVESEPAPMIQPMASTPAPLESSVAPDALMPPTLAVPPVAEAPAPVVREATPTPAVRRVAPVATERRAEPVVPAVEPAVVEPTGPRPYTAELNVAAPQTATPAPAPRAPAIQTAPLN